MDGRLSFPLPAGIRIVARGTGTATLQVSLPWEVVDILATALEYAGRMTGSDKPGMLLCAMAAECLAEWMPRTIEREARMKGG